MNSGGYGLLINREKDIIIIEARKGTSEMAFPTKLGIGANGK